LDPELPTAPIPLALTMIGELYTLAERTRMQAVFSSVWGVASIAGPLVGGFITDFISLIPADDRFMILAQTHRDRMAIVEPTCEEGDMS